MFHKQGGIAPFTMVAKLVSVLFEGVLPNLKTIIERKIGELDETETLKKRLFEVLNFAIEGYLAVYSFKYFMEPTFEFYKPYLHWFSINVRE